MDYEVLNRAINNLYNEYDIVYRDTIFKVTTDLIKEYERIRHEDIKLQRNKRRLSNENNNVKKIRRSKRLP